MKNKKNLKLLFSLLVILMLSGLSYSQVTVDSLETLEDGTVIVTVGGKSYRGLPPEKMREVLVWKETSKHFEEAYNTEVKNFDAYRKLKQSEVVKLTEKTDLEKASLGKDVSFYKSEYEKEKALRIRFEKQLKSCTGKIILFRLCTF